MADTTTGDPAAPGGSAPVGAVLLGVGPGGSELAQVDASCGSGVALVEAAPTLLTGEDAWIGETLADHRRRAGLDVALLTEHTRAFPTWAEAVTPPALALAETLSAGSRMVRP